uniref:Ig-like domain-containing protein n=1 Tax=Neolamprologus brichardi TaxID=32507 RepID=A0A3Q4GIV8_NEOBR
SKSSSWTAAVPSSVKGLLGSCVVIPCSYNYPEPQKSPQTFTGIWYNNDNQVICHSDASQTPAQFQSRTKLLGDLNKKNCSLMIDKLTRRDEGTFHFRIIMEAYAVFSYSKNKISVSVIDEPNPTDFSVQEEVKEGQTVSASCSVFHSCPTYSPSFHWSHSGEQHDQTQKLQNGQWNATSTLTFRSNRSDHNKPLQCSVTYHGGKQRVTSKTLKVKCNEIGTLLNKRQTYTMSNVSRHSIESMYCTAVNEEGRIRSSTVKLNVLCEYKMEEI